jgi:2-C-methyl-D-erythritol 4-phosphate cytidylyltransferase
VAAALLVAAGRGERLGSDRPKALVVAAGRPLYTWALDVLRAAPSIDEVVIAGPPGLDEGADDVRVVPGGAERSHSVRAALAAAGRWHERIVVHDAARPLVSVELVEASLAALATAEAAIAAAPVVDTVKEAGPDGAVVRTLDRTRLWAVQTPQAFRRGALEDALAQPDDVLAAATDDAALVEARGGRVRIVPAPRENLKVTTPLDLHVAELLLAARGGGG